MMADPKDIKLTGGWAKTLVILWKQTEEMAHVREMVPVTT